MVYTQSQLVDALNRFGGGCPVLVNGRPVTDVEIADAPPDVDATTAVNIITSDVPVQPPVPDQPPVTNTDPIL